MKNKFLGSTIALVIGALAILGGLANPSSLLFAGISITLSALAYKSAKKQKIGIIKASSTRQILEIVGLVIMVLLILFQNNLAMNLYNDPFPNIVIPIWGIIAYLVVIFKTKNIDNPIKD
jgi:hypothetical protein